MGDARSERMAKNEVLFRSLNERVREITDTLALNGVVENRALEEYLCECADEQCMEQVRLTRREYEDVRANPLRFFVALGHVAPEIEEIVGENERFTVVEKAVGEQDIARATDPRSAA